MPNIGIASRDKNSVPALIVQSNTGIRSDPLVDLWADPTTHRLLVDANVTVENITIPTPGIGLQPYDYVARVLTNSTTETYTFKSGGSGGTTTNTIVIVYTDNTLATISTVTKT